MPVRLLKKFVTVVASNGTSVSQKLTLEPGAKRIVGFHAVADRPDIMLYRGRIGLTISGLEVQDPETHAQLLMCSVAVKPNDRFLKVSYDPGNLEVKVTLTDKAHTTIAFAAYTLTLYVAVEFEDLTRGDDEAPNEELG